MSRESLPVLVSIKERYRLNRPGSLKETYHIVLDLAHSSLEYEVGDCVGIYPLNHPHYIDRILHALGASGEETIIDRDAEAHLLRDFLQRKANLSRISKKLLEGVKAKTSVSQRRFFLEHLLSPDQKETLRNFIETNHVIDLVEDLHGFSPQQFCDFLSPLMPRFYSIASSRHAVGSEIHLTVAVTRYQIQEAQRTGVCSDFLCHLTNLHEPVVPIFLQKARDFVLSKEALGSPMIMIGPGTGVAPFRGFMQERLEKNATAPNWLFFGERNRDYDFYYEEFWTSLVNQNRLQMDLAFSRDQPHKVYVQHKMLEKGAELWKWIQEGAYLYVCGDASRMAKDVDATLHRIVEQQGGLTDQAAKSFVKQLRHQGRYLRDVY